MTQHSSETMLTKRTVSMRNFVTAYCTNMKDPIAHMYAMIHEMERCSEIDKTEEMMNVVKLMGTVVESAMRELRTGIEATHHEKK